MPNGCSLNEPSGCVRTCPARSTIVGDGRRDVRWLGLLAVVGVQLFLAVPAQAHQRVDLGPADVSPVRGHLLPDGTVSYAVQAGGSSIT